MRELQALPGCQHRHHRHHHFSTGKPAATQPSKPPALSTRLLYCTCINQPTNQPSKQASKHGHWSIALTDAAHTLSQECGCQPLKHCTTQLIITLEMYCEPGKDLSCKVPIVITSLVEPGAFAQSTARQGNHRSHCEPYQHQRQAGTDTTYLF